MRRTRIHHTPSWEGEGLEDWSLAHPMARPDGVRQVGTFLLLRVESVRAQSRTNNRISACGSPVLGLSWPTQKKGVGMVVSVTTRKDEMDVLPPRTKKDKQPAN
mmetsp:Transcript_9756/g.22489  ORF Transcript_9756/g.22489 Transcript_9756/m.22489 type:complete len:104 (+) Transcript_9756:948-1259(+)